MNEWENEGGEAAPPPCPECGLGMADDALVRDRDGDQIHEDCAEYCDHCSEYIRRSEGSLVWSDLANEWRCESCLPTCDTCDEKATVEDRNGYNRCDDHARACYGCGNIHAVGRYGDSDYMYFCDDIGEYRCEYCCEYCDTCDQYHAGECEARDDSTECCEPTHLRFTVHGLESDTQRTMVGNKGHVSEAGLELIRKLIYSWAVEHVPDTWRATHMVSHVGTELVTKEGKYAKRLRSTVHKLLEKNLPNELVTEIGNIAASYSKGIDLTISLTRDLNLPAEEFAHSDSCWWQSYSYSRCTLKENAGMGLRSFNNCGVTGRSWVIPFALDEHGELKPTFEEADAYVVFNGYGELREQTGPQVMADLTGWNIRRIPLRWSQTMYINGDYGYLIAPDHIEEGAVPTYLPSHAV